MKGRDKYGRPTEGVHEVPVKPKREKQNEKCLSQLVDMLQQAKHKYHSLYQEHVAYILSGLCMDCQMRPENAGNSGCYEVCNECKEKIKP